MILSVVHLVRQQESMLEWIATTTTPSSSLTEITSTSQKITRKQNWWNWHSWFDYYVSDSTRFLSYAPDYALSAGAEPSYKRICRVILQHDTGEENKDNNNNNNNVYARKSTRKPSKVQSIYENMSTCLEKDDLSSALSHMFASAFLSHVAQNVNGIPVQYQHRCHMRLYDAGSDGDDGSKTTVQQFFPVDIDVLDDTTNNNNNNQDISSQEQNKGGSMVMNASNLKRLCFQAIDMNRDEGAWHVLDQKLGENANMGGNTKRIVSVLQAMLPTIRRTLTFAVEAWEQAGHGTLFFRQRRRIQETISGYLIETAKKKPWYKRKSWGKSSTHEAQNKNNNHASSSPILRQPDGSLATIYLPCIDALCSDMLILPNHVYPLEIPNSIKRLDLIVPFSCFEKISACRHYANSLAKFLVEYYPRADVMLVRHKQDANMDTYSRILNADYALVGPGWFTSSLFSILLRRRGTYLTVFQQAHVERTRMEFLRQRLPLKAFNHGERVMFKSISQVERLSSFEDNNVNFGFTNQNLPSNLLGQCRHIRGQRGGWVKNKEYELNITRAYYSNHQTVGHDRNDASATGAASSLFGISGGQSSNTTTMTRETRRLRTRDPSLNQPSASFRWVDGRGIMTSSGPTCPVEFLTRESLCLVMDQLSMKRIMLVGDTTALNQAISLYKLLGETGLPPFTKNKNNGYKVKLTSFKTTIKCPPSPTSVTNNATLSSKPKSQSSFDLEYVRNDKMTRFSQSELRLKSREGEYDSTQWEPRLSADLRATLLVFRFGSRLEDSKEFRHAFARIVATLDILNEQRERQRRQQITTKNGSSGRGRDIVFLGTNVPVHGECQTKQQQQPFKTYAEYLQEEKNPSEEKEKDDRAHHHLFRQQVEDRNDFMTRQIDERRRKQQQQRQQQLNEQDAASSTLLSTHIEILDVYPMTVLRADGHVKKGDEITMLPPDCLHYSLPGPVDFWNHLMYSNLQDIAAAAAPLENHIQPKRK